QWTGRRYFFPRDEGHLARIRSGTIRRCTEREIPVAKAKNSDRFASRGCQILGMTSIEDVAVVSAKGMRRWQHGHPWIYRSDITRRPTAPAGAVRVHDHRNRPLGVALWSPASEISLRMIDGDASATLDHDWWRRRLGDSITRREPVQSVATAYRLVHGEGDAC